MPTVKLPFGSEFSPSQIELPRVLEMVGEAGGDADAFNRAVLKTYFAEHGTDDKSRLTLAKNTRLGLIAYGILDRDTTQLTDFGKELHALRADPKKLYDALAKHILLNLSGMALVTCIQEMGAAGDDVSLDTLREALAQRGVEYPRGGKHPSMMRLWLAKAGVFVGSRWQIDQKRMQEVLGADPDQFSVLAGFTPEQRAFVRALANTGVREPQPANKIAELATKTFGVRFPEKSLPKLVLDKLRDAGYITATKTTEGRGAKPFLVAPTEKLQKDIVEPLLEQLAGQQDPKLMALLRKPLAEILAEMKAEDRYVAGLALEALAFRLMRLLDMDYIGTRLRGNQTGGAEVDLLFHSARLVYSRWQVQCKNTSRVSLEDVAKEVGLVHMLKSNVIVIVSTGEIGGEARRYANTVMRDSNLAIVMVDRSDILRIEQSPPDIVDVFHREAQHTMALKPSLEG